VATYEYKCELGHSILIERSMTQEETETTCTAPDCNGGLQRVYTAPVVTFKGTGFYSKGG